MLDSGFWELMCSETAILGRSGGFSGKLAGEPRLRWECVHGRHRCVRGCSDLANALNACDEGIVGGLGESHACVGRESAGFGGWRLSGTGVWKHRAFRLLASGTYVFWHRASCVLASGINRLDISGADYAPRGPFVYRVRKADASRQYPLSDSLRAVYDFCVNTF